MPIQFRTVLAENATERIVQEPDGTLWYDTMFSNRPYQSISLQEKDVGDIRSLLYNEKATLEERLTTIPIAKDLAGGRTPRAQDVRAVRDANIIANSRSR